MNQAKKTLLLGNEAIAEAAMEAGVGVACAYPGTPSTDILEYLGRNCEGRFHVEWSVNEKVSLETCAGASYAGTRSICSMKHVGLNVAMDPFMTLAYTGINAGLLLVVADDPGMHSSQNEQDSRHLIAAAKLLSFEPADSQEAHDMALAAFDLSERLDLPVCLRTMTRISHTATPVTLGERSDPVKKGFVKDPRKYVMVPANARERHKLLLSKQKDIGDYVENCEYNTLEMNGSEETGIVACGPAYNLAKEYGEGCAILKCGTLPIPQKKLEKLVSCVKKIIVLEEGDPVVEKEVRCIHGNVIGKISGELPLYGELLPETVMPLFNTPTVEMRKISDPAVSPPPRPPMLCPGCPHRGTYYALKQTGAQVLTGDIGCYTLGVQKPLGMLDTCLCMGASVNKAAGMDYSGVENVYGVVGESTFLHSGITGLINSVYNGANYTLLILDNNNTAMTGHQPTPLTGLRADGTQGKTVDLEEICRACGAELVERFDPLDLEGAKNVIKKASSIKGVKVLIATSPCVMLKGVPRGPAHEIDAGTCVKCGACLNLGCPAVSKAGDGTISINPILCTGCGLCAQVCPKGAIKTREVKG